MQLALDIVQHIPLWVWAIFAFILVMGTRQLRETRMQRTRLLVLPGIWLVFGAWGVTKSFGTEAAPLAAWAIGLVASLALVRRLKWPGQSRFEAATQAYVVPGSVLPLVIMLGIFCAKFTLGVSLAMHPMLAQGLLFATGFSLLFGVLSGTLLGRSITILSRAKSS